MKLKVGQKVRIGKSPKCVADLERFHITGPELDAVRGRIAYIREIRTWCGIPAVHLNFPGKRPQVIDDLGYALRDPELVYPRSVLRKS